MKEQHSYEEKGALFEKLVEKFPEIERKGATIPYTSWNGNMFSQLDQKGVLAIRLPQEERESFIKKYKTGLHEAYGIVQKEYVDVPDTLLSKTAELSRWFEKSIAYVKTLKPKATTKPKKKASG